MSNPPSLTPASLSRWRSPSLRVTSKVEGVNHASWIELFFDLVFVVVIEELSHYLSEHLSLVGFLQFAALFVPCWWAWVLFTFYADRYDTDDVPHRLLILSGMLAAIFLAATVHHAFGNSGVGFVWSYVAIRSIVLLLYMRSVMHVAVAWANLRLYLTSYLPSTMLWIASLWFDGIPRYSLWALAMSIELAVPIAGSRLLVKTPAHPSHLPERFGLLTLIVLGEAIISVASATANLNGNVIQILAAVGGFVIAASLWWLYFSFLESSIRIRSIASVHLYNYGHLPILLGLTTIAVGVGHTIQEVDQPVLETGTRWALCGGMALYSLAIAIIMFTACRRQVTIYSFALILVALGLAIFGAGLPPLAIEGFLITALVVKVSVDIFSAPPSPEASEDEGSAEL
ncbi:low temperature requirement protein A [Nostoc sp. LPT]|uniref:low temperature requirement protein A n=1 Tax=Nostoc sp. LPT TaxID=2815387 RepID=UPI001D1D0A7E|nr:low temperature requirement protein A [Nostoc sp. LPT]MBN4004740.1 low temperature requirement protein A [Nostoc sp. LPT]